MKTSASLLATCLLLSAIPASAETVGESTGVNSTLGIAPKTADFVTEAAISDMFEIKSSQLAEMKADSSTKAFAKQMVEDHTKTTMELKPLAMAANTTIPSEMDSSHKKMLDDLSKLSGDDFNKEYRKDQVSAHKDAVSLFTRYSKGGSDDKLKSFASKTLPTLQGHLKMSQELSDKKSS